MKKKKNIGPAGTWTVDLENASQTRYHWANSPVDDVFSKYSISIQDDFITEVICVYFFPAKIFSTV